MVEHSSRPIQGDVRHILSKGADAPKNPAPSRWFMGPNAENAADMADYAQIIVDAHAAFRRDFAPDDPPFIDPDNPEPSSLETRTHIETALRQTLADLRNSIPLASYRNQSHMYWDITLPGAAGYFAGMLYNQNNVAAEASPVTTAMEIAIANDLCNMLGFDTASDPAPWGHIACDGSIANAEAMWAARNVTFHAAAIATALRVEPKLAKAQNVTVKTGAGARRKLLALTPWELLNLPTAEVLTIAESIAKVTGFDAATIHHLVDPHSIQSLGPLGFYRATLDAHTPEPIVIVPATAHYSWAKGAAILGLGKANTHLVPVDMDGRMDTVALREKLEHCLETHTPVTMVVAVIGTTKESAVDPLADIIDIQTEYAERGLTFCLHADAAWGGYFASMIQPKTKLTAPIWADAGLSPEEAMSPYVAAQFRALGGCDTITIDPHKSGFIPYPAGALCYRDERLPALISHTDPVVFHGGSAPTVGVYGMEGSKPGAAAVGAHLSHQVIPLDDTGYGTLLGRCMFNAKRYYAAVVAMDDTAYTVTPFQRLPVETAGGTPLERVEQIALIRAEFLKPTNTDLGTRLRARPDLLALFRALGPDLTVFAYAFNFRTTDGLNTDTTLMNEMNDRMYDALSLQIDERRDIPDRKMFVTAAEWDPATYGAEVVAGFAARAGLDYDQTPISYLISTMQNPWITQTAEGNFIPQLTAALDETARDVIAAMAKRHGFTPVKGA